MVENVDVLLIPSDFASGIFRAAEEGDDTALSEPHLCRKKFDIGLCLVQEFWQEARSIYVPISMAKQRKQLQSITWSSPFFSNEMAKNTSELNRTQSSSGSWVNLISRRLES